MPRRALALQLALCGALALVGGAGMSLWLARVGTRSCDGGECTRRTWHAFTTQRASEVRFVDDRVLEARWWTRDGVLERCRVDDDCAFLPDGTPVLAAHLADVSDRGERAQVDGNHLARPTCFDGRCMRGLVAMGTPPPPPDTVPPAEPEPAHAAAPPADAAPKPVGDARLDRPSTKGCDPVLDFDCKAGAKPAPHGGGAKDALSKADVLTVVKPGLPAVEACGKKHDAHGGVKVTWRIQPSGAVSEVAVVDAHAGTPVGACVSGVVKSWKFPAHRTAGAPVTFSFKLP